MQRTGCGTELQDGSTDRRLPNKNRRRKRHNLRRAEGRTMEDNEEISREQILALKTVVYDEGTMLVIVDDSVER